MRALLKWAAIAWVSVGTLMMLIAAVGAITNPRTHLGLGLVSVMGRKSLLVSVPLLVTGFSGARLAAKDRAAGPWVIVAFSLVFAVCLGLEQFSDFEPIIAVIAALFTLTTIWGCWTGIQHHRRLTPSSIAGAD